MTSSAMLGVLAGAVLTSAASSVAAIECRENYQIVQGQPISTPYCRDGYLAAVARQYGFKTTAATVRNNPSRKEEICRYIGHDIRVQTACSEVEPTPYDSR